MQGAVQVSMGMSLLAFSVYAAWEQKRVNLSQNWRHLFHVRYTIYRVR